ncbi:hypothetical protein GCM10027343_31730 [Noviherbaspirillum agri]
MFVRLALSSALAAALAAQVHAQPISEGFLCCNMRTDGSWISDINYAEAGKRMIPVGTPVKGADYGRFRVYVELEGDTQAIGNDYSRDLSMDAFAQRYIVATDPKAKIAGYPEKVREAIKTARVRPGMTREQVIMSVGYPVSSENPNLDAKVWRFWLSSFAEFQVMFDDAGRVKEIATFDPHTRSVVVME